MSESEKADVTPDDPAGEIDDDLTGEDYEDLPLEARVAWLRYAAVSLVGRAQRAERREKAADKRARAAVIIAACAVVIALIAVALGVYVMLSTADKTDIRNEQYDYTQKQIRDLVCAIPPGDVARDALRERAQCGAYEAPSSGRVPSSARPAGSSPATASPSVTPRPTLTIERPQAAAPSASAPSQARSAPQSRPVPGRTVTRTATPPTATRTVTPAPSRTQGLVPSLLCTLLGCD